MLNSTGMKIYILLPVIALFGTVWTLRLPADVLLDPGTCFNPTLRNLNFDQSSDALKRVTLARIDRDEWTMNYKGKSFAGEYKFIGASAEFKDFDTSRAKYFEENSLDLESYRTNETASQTLSTYAPQIIKECFGLLASQVKGFKSSVSIVNERTAILTFYWNKPETSAADTIRLLGAIVGNATVLGSTNDNPFSSRPEVSGVQSFTLQRTDVNSAITMTSFSTYPLVSVEPIVIKPLPRITLPTPNETKQWPSPCIESRDGVCDSCEFPVQFSAVNQNNPPFTYTCDHMRPGQNVAAIYHGSLDHVQPADQPPIGGHTIDVRLDSDSACSNEFCQATSQRASFPVTLIASGVVDQQGKAAYQFRITSCGVQAPSPIGLCRSTGVSKLRVTVLSGGPLKP